VMANRLEYPDDEELKKTIKGLSKSAWFIEAADMARNLGAQIASMW